MPGQVPRGWDAATYHRLSEPQLRRGKALVDRLDLRGDERVLDAGCGSCPVTALILEHLPEGSVVAMDSSAWLHDEPTETPAEDFSASIETECLGRSSQGMDDPEREAFVRDVAERMPDRRIDHVRLNLTARRGGEALR